MKSLWLESSPRIPVDTFQADGQYDSVVVGAGITGLTTATLLARSGQRVAVLEARTVGAVTTGNSTAKVSLLRVRQGPPVDVPVPDQPRAAYGSPA